MKQEHVGIFFCWVTFINHFTLWVKILGKKRIRNKEFKSSVCSQHRIPALQHINMPSSSFLDANICFRLRRRRGGRFRSTILQRSLLLLDLERSRGLLVLERNVLRHLMMCRQFDRMAGFAVPERRFGSRSDFRRVYHQQELTAGGRHRGLVQPGTDLEKLAEGSGFQLAKFFSGTPENRSEGSSKLF